jgi:hypothetical protein
MGWGVTHNAIVVGDHFIVTLNSIVEIRDNALCYGVGPCCTLVARQRIECGWSWVKDLGSRETKVCSFTVKTRVALGECINLRQHPSSSH